MMIVWQYGWPQCDGLVSMLASSAEWFSNVSFVLDY